MRRKDLEITERSKIDAILGRALVCRLAMSDGRTPYIVPLVFGYENGVLYFHSAREGRKIEMIRANPSVCFEVDIEHELVTSGEPCKWGMKYNSVIGFGSASLVEEAGEKKRALEAITAHYGGGAPMPEDKLESTAVIRVDIESLTGRTTYRQAHRDAQSRPVNGHKENDSGMQEG